MGFLDLIAGIFKPAAELIDELHTSEEEKIIQQRRLLEIQAMVLDSSLQYEKELMTAKANTQYSETTNALDQLQKAVGTKIDFDSANADKSLGTAARKLMSNYQSRVQMLDAIELANEIAARYGLKIQDDLIAQVIFANEIDRMFGAAAATSLKGQMQEAMRTGVEMARGDAVQRALDLALSASERMRGINEENAIKAIEALLKRQEKGKR